MVKFKQFRYQVFHPPTSALQMGVQVCGEINIAKILLNTKTTEQLFTFFLFCFSI